MASAGQKLPIRQATGFGSDDEAVPDTDPSDVNMEDFQIKRPTDIVLCRRPASSSSGFKRTSTHAAI